MLSLGQLAAIRAIVSHSRAAGRDRLLVVLDRLIDDYPRPQEQA